MRSIKERPSESLEVVLAQREAKADHIRALSKRYHASVIGIRINIPGPHKKEAWAFKLYKEAVRAVSEKMRTSGIAFFESEFKEHYEFLMLMVANETPVRLKAMCVEIEEQHALGRIFDLDVYMEDGIPLSRERSNQRKCYICDEPAHVCARSRAHDMDELISYLISKAASL